MKFAGSYVALPSPFAAGGIDRAAFQRLVEFQVAAGSAGVVVAGTTGEGSTLEDDERRELIEIAVDQARGRLSVVAGVGTNCTRTTAILAREAQAAGADALLVVTPYYNKPNRTGLLAHFGAVREASDLPLVLYNVPSRTGLDLEPERVAELVRTVPRIAAIKEATPHAVRVAALRRLGLDVLAGDDAHALEFARHGAAGLIGVTGNLLPEAVRELLIQARPGGDATRVTELAGRLAVLNRALFLEVNPVPLKHALERLGRCGADVRAPLGPLEAETRRQVEAALHATGLLALPSILVT